jgi:hypothetical protein
MYEPASRHTPNAAFLWPALFAASASEVAAHFAKQFTTTGLSCTRANTLLAQFKTPGMRKAGC